MDTVTVVTKEKALIAFVKKIEEITGDNPERQNELIMFIAGIIHNIHDIHNLEKFTLEVKKTTGDNPERQNELIGYIVKNLPKIFEEYKNSPFCAWDGD